MRTLVGWLVLGSSYFSQDVVHSVFVSGTVCSILGVVRAKNGKYRNLHMGP